MSEKLSDDQVDAIATWLERFDEGGPQLNTAKALRELLAYRQALPEACPYCSPDGTAYHGDSETICKHCGGSNEAQLPEDAETVRKEIERARAFLYQAMIHWGDHDTWDAVPMDVRYSLQAMDIALSRLSAAKGEPKEGPDALDDWCHDSDMEDR